MGKVDDLAEEIHGNMAELTAEVATMKEGWEQLSAANIDINGRLDSLDRNQVEMRSQMSRMTEALTRIEATLHSDVSHRNNDAPETSGVREVRNQNPIEPGGNQTLGYRGINNVLENRNAVLKKIELPSLDGSSPYGWISLAERFFRLGRYSDAERLDLLSITLKGPALHWFNREMLREPFTDWPQFKKRMIARFSQKVEENPGKRLFSLKQTGSIVDYVNEFEELTTIVTGIDEENLEHMFYIGLKQEMKEVMKMQKPRGLTNCFNTVISMEDSVFCKTMAETANPTRRINSFFPLRSASNYNSQTNFGNNSGLDAANLEAKNAEQYDKNKDLGSNQNAKPPWRNNAGQNYSGMLKLTPAEIAEKRRLGLCYKCPEKWSKTHDYNCQSRQLQAFTVIDNEAVEILDKEWAEGFQEEFDIVPELRELSLLSYLGVDSPAATKLWGEIDNAKVVVMIDSGATHNFIDPSVLRKTKLSPARNRSLEILLGTGITVNGSGICKDASIALQSHEFTTDFIVLELGNADIILGVQWLRTLGKCGYDWDKHEMSFMYKGEMITLFGDPELLAGRGNLKALQTLSGAEQMGFNTELFDMNQTEVIQVISEQLQQSLDKFEEGSTSMKNNATTSRRELSFTAAARFYGPFEVLEKIGEVAYRLKLHEESKIHPVFHVSQLKPVIGSGHLVSTLPDSFEARPEFIIEPETVLDTRYDAAGPLEGLVQWKGLPEHKKAWVRASVLLQQFPELEDKLLVNEGGIVRVTNRYVKKRKKRLEKKKLNQSEEDELETVAELDE